MKERHEGGNEGPGGPPMLVLIPPPDAEKPEDVEMSDDPEERHGQILETFFRMMDGDGSGELNFDELGSWAHPAPMMGPGMGGEMDEEMRREHMHKMAEELRAMRRHENQLKEELSQIRNHIREMQENLEREEEEGQDGPPNME